METLTTTWDKTIINRTDDLLNWAELIRQFVSRKHAPTGPLDYHFFSQISQQLDRSRPMPHVVIVGVSIDLERRHDGKIGMAHREGVSQGNRPRQTGPSRSLPLCRVPDYAECQISAGPSQAGGNKRFGIVRCATGLTYWGTSLVLPYDQQLR